MNLKPLFNIAIGLLVGIIAFSSCNDIIEPSISKSQVQLEAPADQYQSNSYTINFWWDQVDHALTYHLQVVTPSFASPGSLVLDTVVSANKFAFNLNPGLYQWRVMAENGSSQTVFSSPRTFTILQSSISQQSVQLTAPANQTLTNQSTVTFQWGSIYSANAYQIEIDTNNFANVNTIVYNQLIPGQQVSFTFPKDQVYEWRVRAQNDTAQAQWSAINYITYDHTPPGQVSLVAPTGGQTVSLPVLLQWGAVATAAKYKLYVLQGDSTTTFNASFPLLLNTTDYSFNLGASGEKIYWKVSAVDAAGNEGQASSLSSFVLQ